MEEVGCIFFSTLLHRASTLQKSLNLTYRYEIEVIIMANSRFEYVRQFESYETLLPDTYIVVRIDGKKFHEFSRYYEFQKPNDERAIKLAYERQCKKRNAPLSN